MLNARSLTIEILQLASVVPSLSRVHAQSVPVDCTPRGSSVHGIPQARTLEGGAIQTKREDKPQTEQLWARADFLIPAGQLQRWGGAGLQVEGPKVGGAADWWGKTHVDEMVSVSNEQVAQDASFIEVPQADHVLHAVDRRGVHGLDVRGVLRGDPVFLQRCTVANVSSSSWDTGCTLPGKGPGRDGNPGSLRPHKGLVLSCGQTLLVLTG